MILITGGAGFIGRHLAALLALLGGQQVRALSRSPERVFEGAEETMSVGLQAIERLSEAGLFDQETLATARERAQRGEQRSAVPICNRTHTTAAAAHTQGMGPAACHRGGRH